MFRDEKLELKVGLFSGIGFALIFLFTLLVSDTYLWGKGNEISIVFDFVNGITDNAPVRLAGVNVGEVRKIEIYREEDTAATKIKLHVWIRTGILIPNDSVIRINTLGLLGEQYIEITPGVSREFFKDKDEVIGRNPVNVGQQVEIMKDFAKSATNIIQAIEKGDGTLGKLLKEDSLYFNLDSIFSKLNKGEGTLGKLITDEKLYGDIEEITGKISRGEGSLGKLLTDEEVYSDLRDFTKDIKEHPWKLLQRPSDRDKKMDDKISKKSGSRIEPKNKD